MSLAVLALWWLTRPLLGERRAIVAAGLFAVSPIVALQASLSIPEGPLLLSIVVAQCALLRLYCAPDEEREGFPWLALLFWAAQGTGMLLNALAVPILSASTIVALYVFDRRLDWLKRLQPLWGVPLMLAIAAPWLLIRAHFDGGVPFSQLSFGEFIRALGGAQDMKWKAAPLTFTAALLLGFLPGALLIVPALQGLWRGRAAPVQRFLFCWIVGYWLYLELIASKPALYTVQAMFPAAAAAVALALDRALPEAGEQNSRLAIPPLSLALPWWLVLPGDHRAVCRHSRRLRRRAELCRRRRRRPRHAAVHARCARHARWPRRSLGSLQHRRLRALHRLHVRRADAAHQDGLAGPAHRRGRRAAAPLRDGAGWRRRIPRAVDHLRPRPRQRCRCRNHRRMDGRRR
ncbi:MAG: glycosyltransferase family 39 protein [Hyphomicrobium sp.]